MAYVEPDKYSPYPRAGSAELPASFCDDSADLRLPDTVFTGKRNLPRARPVFISNVRDEVPVKLRRDPFLGDHVADVVPGIPEKEVVRSDAGRVVAAMENVSVADIPEVQPPRQAMCAICAAPRSKRAVAVAVSPGNPLPASISGELGYFCHQTFNRPFAAGDRHGPEYTSWLT